MQQHLEILSQSPIFKGIEKEELNKLLSTKTFQKKSFDKNIVVVSEREECNNLLIIAEGSVRGEMSDENDKVLKIEDIYPPRPIAPAFVFGKNCFYPVAIITNEASVIYYFPKHTFIKIMQENETVLYNFLNIISDRAQFLSDKIKFLQFNTIKIKILKYIFDITGERQKNIFLPLNQTKLSELFGITRPSLARALNELEKEGFFRVCRSQILDINLEKIKSYIKNR
jgi:CRP-like cAMP-binding protein